MDIQYLSDKQGKQTAIVIPIKLWQKMKEKLEMWEDVKAFDQAVQEDDGSRIPIEEAFEIIEQKRKIQQ